MVWKTISDTPYWQKWKNDSGAPIREIHVFSNINLQIIFLTKGEGRAFHQLFKGTPIPVSFLEACGICDNIVEISQNTPYLNDFLRILLKVDPSIQVFLPELLKQLKLSPSLGLDLKQLKALPKDEAISKTKEAQENGSYDLIWELFNLYESDYIPQENPEDPSTPLPGRNQSGITLQELYDLASAVSTNSPHYKKAQSKCMDLLMQAELPESEDEKHKLLELKFQYAVKGGDQKLADLLFAELCGMRLGEHPIQNVQPNFETLFAVAKAFRELKQAPQAAELPSQLFKLS